jgi:hypothetical protein
MAADAGTSVAPQAMSGVLQSLPADWVVRMLQIAWPCAVGSMGKALRAGIETLNRRAAARAAREQAPIKTEAGQGLDSGPAATAGEPSRPLANGSNGAVAAADGPSLNGSNGTEAGNQAGRAGRERRSKHGAGGVEEAEPSSETTQLLMDVLEDLPIGNGANGPNRRAGPGTGLGSQLES